MAYQALGQNRDALAAFARAVAMAPGDGRSLGDLVAADLLAHRPIEALAALAAAPPRLLQDPRLLSLRTLALTQTGNLAAAHGDLAELSRAAVGGSVPAVLAGRVALAAFDIPAATAYFTDALKKNPHDVPARLGLARSALMQGDYAAWKAETAAALADAPANVSLALDASNILLQHHDSDAATTLLRDAHEAAPNAAQVTEALGNLYIAAGAPDKALALATEREQGAAPASNAAWPTTLLAARAQEALGDIRAAVETYRRLPSSSPESPLARMEIARLLAKVGDHTGADLEIADALAAFPQDLHVLRTAVAAAAAKGAAAAMRTATELAQVPAHQPAALQVRADVLAELGRYSDAATAYRTAFDAHPSVSLARRVAAAMYQAGDVAGAKTMLQSWILAHHGDLDAEQGLADLDTAALDFPGARDVLREIVAQQPDDAIALNNLAVVEQHLSDPAARTHAAQAFALAPGPRTADTWGYIEATGGNGSQAVALLRLANAEDPGRPSLTFHLAVALSKAGDPAEARAVLDSLLKRNTAFSERIDADALLARLSGSNVRSIGPTAQAGLSETTH